MFLKDLRQFEIKCKNADVIQKAGQADKIQPEKVHRTSIPGEINQIHKNLSKRRNTKQKQLVRCFRYKDLYDNVLFNYQVSFIIILR